MMKRVAVSAAVASGVLCAPAPAEFSMTIEEVGSDVVLTGSGSFDLSLWGPPSAVGNNDDPFMSSTGLLTAPIGSMLDGYNDPTGFAGPSIIPFSGPAPVMASSVSGDPLFLVFIPSIAQIHVPRDYISGAPLTTGMVFENHTLDTLGLVPDTYTWTWDTKDGGGDFYSIQVVPAPGAVALIGVAGACGGRRRRA